MDKYFLENFVAESNRIEGIRHVSDSVFRAHQKFLDLWVVTIPDLQDFVEENARGHLLRDHPRVPGVRVGNHIAPDSGPEIRNRLEAILQMEDPYQAHLAYENLHPFTDGNGRSGRVLWLWMMLQKGGRDASMAKQLGFLHSFYYQSLASLQLG